jgi:hypothetical protein
MRLVRVCHRYAAARVRKSDETSRLDVPSNYFHELATWSSINRLYNRRVIRELQEVRREAARPRLIDRLLHVVESEGGHSLAMEVEETKISLPKKLYAPLRLAWIEPELDLRLRRRELAARTAELARRIAEQIGLCVRQAGLSGDQIDALFLTGARRKCRMFVRRSGLQLRAQELSKATPSERSERAYSRGGSQVQTFSHYMPKHSAHHSLG